MRVAALSALLVLVGCAEPASLEVRVKVEVGADNPGKVSALTVRVRTAGGTLVDCRLPKMGASEGTCPFEAGDGQWDGVGDLRFFLYGGPGTAATVIVGAEHEGRTLTGTVSQVVLPSVAGAREVFDLALTEPATPTRRCSADLRDLGAPSGLSIVQLASLGAQVGPRDVLVSVGPTLRRFRYERENDSCKLTSRPLVDSKNPRGVGSKWCKLRAGSMVARRQELPSPHHVVAGICAGLGTQSAVMAKLGSDGQVEIRNAMIDSGGAPPSQPVLADTDGDGQLELILLSWVRNRRVELRRHGLLDGSAATGTSAATLVEFATPQPEARLIPFPPIVLPSPSGGAPETLVFVGYGGAAQYSDGRVAAFATNSALSERFSLGPPVAYRLDTGSFVVVSRPLGCQVARGLLVARERSWQFQSGGTVDIGECREPGVGRSVDALTVGRRVGQSAASVALSVGDRVFVGDLEQPRQFRGLSVVLAQTTQAKLLAANIDGIAGAEWIAFKLLSGGRVEIGAGPAIRGWPIALDGAGLGQYVLGDLDGVVDTDFGLRDLEIVSLSDGDLQVISLGLGSYDSRGLDWPSAGHSAHGGRAWIDGSDPGL